jgi:hypothetical protein
VQLPRLRHPPQRHALWPLLRGFFGLRNRTPGLLSSAHHRGPSKAGPLWECLGTHPPPAPVPAGAKAPGISIHSPQILGIHLSVLPNPSLGTDPLRQASLPVWRVGLCCTTRASRPASAVGVSSNVGPRRLPPQTADIAGACLPPYPPALARPSTLTPASGASGRFRGIRGQGASPP